jgi:pimeloyl-ACP methyl ester carboxylesterase
MGGAVALMFAAVRPEVVLSVTAIESLGPTSGDPAAITSRLRNFVEDSNKPIRKRVYPTMEAALARVRENNSSLSEAAARHMTSHGLEPVDSGFQFTFDPVLRRRNIFPFTEEQMAAILRTIQCPVLVVHATDGLSFDDEQMKRRLSCLKVVGPVVIEGGHHVHLDRPVDVAAHIQRFVESLTPSLGTHGRA